MTRLVVGGASFVAYVIGCLGGALAFGVGSMGPTELGALSDASDVVVAARVRTVSMGAFKSEVDSGFADRDIAELDVIDCGKGRMSRGERLKVVFAAGVICPPGMADYGAGELVVAFLRRRRGGEFVTVGGAAGSKRMADQARAVSYTRRVADRVRALEGLTGADRERAALSWAILCLETRDTRAEALSELAGRGWFDDARARTKQARLRKLSSSDVIRIGVLMDHAASFSEMSELVDVVLFSGDTRLVLELAAAARRLDRGKEAVIQAALRGLALACGRPECLEAWWKYSARKADVERMTLIESLVRCARQRATGVAHLR